MLSFEYAEQLTMASSHFAEFVNLAVQWDMTAVEPIVKTSRLFGFHSASKSWQREPSYWYGRLFNLALVSEKLSKCLLGTTCNWHHNASCSSIILPIHDFFFNSYRNITVVLFVQDHSPPTLRYDIRLSDVENKVFQSKMDFKGNTNSQKIVDCTPEGKKTGVMRRVESLLNSEASRNNHEADFVVKRMICVSRHGVVSLVDLKESLFPSQIRNQSVVFLSWQGLRTVYTFKEEKMLQKCRLDLMPHSDEVFKTSEQFIL